MRQNGARSGITTGVRHAAVDDKRSGSTVCRKRQPPTGLFTLCRAPDASRLMVGMALFQALDLRGQKRQGPVMIFHILNGADSCANGLFQGPNQTGQPPPQQLAGPVGLRYARSALQ